MADKRISDFSTLQQVQDTDLMLVSSLNETYNVQVSTLVDKATESVQEAVEGAIRYDDAQILTDAQKETGRRNIDAASVADVGVPETVKSALLQCFEKVAWIDGNGQQYYDALYEALYQVAPPAWRVLSADDIASSVGLSGLSIDGNGNIQWSDAILMSIIALSQNLKRANYGIRSGVYPYSATIATIFVFKKESDNVFWGVTGTIVDNVRIPIPIKFTKSGDHYTYTDNVQYPMTYENFSSFGEEAEISAQLDNDVLTISNEYGARLTLSGANMLGWYINPNMSIELSGVRVSE